MNTSLSRTLLAISTTACFTVFDAQAVALTPGSLQFLSGTTSAARPELNGTILVDTIRPFSITLASGTITGTVQDRVVRSGIDGTLDFYFQVKSDASSSGSIIYSTRDAFDGFVTDTDWRIDGVGTVAPNSAYREPVYESQVTFGFLSDPIDPGEASRLFFVKTNATNYIELAYGTLIGVGSTGNGKTALFSAYAPIDPIPVPAAVWLFGSGLLGLVATARRRRQQG